MMNPGDLEREIALRHNLLELIKCCPVKTCHPEDCLLSAVVNMNENDRARWLNSLNLESLEFLTSYQFVCCEHKLAGQAAHPPA